jgi:hypothetical protein
MAKLKLIKSRSYTGKVKASKKQPFVDVETEQEVQALVATGYFELCASEVSSPVQDENEGDDGDSVPDYEGLSEMSKAELATYATEHEIDIDGCKTKADILKAISIANGGSSTMIDLQQ